jgi:hypothetical protein
LLLAVVRVAGVVRVKGLVHDLGRPEAHPSGSRHAQGLRPRFARNPKEIGDAQDGAEVCGAPVILGV